MKIAYIYDVIYPYVKGGAEKRFWELAKRLSSRGHQVHLIGMKSWEGDNYLFSEGVHIHGICAAKNLYLKNGRRNAGQVLYFTWYLIPFLSGERFDIIDCNAFPYVPFLLVKLFAGFRKIPLVTTWQELWGTYWYKYLGYFKGTIGRIAELLVILLSDNIIVHTEIVKKEIGKCGISKNKRVNIISHGIDFKTIEAVPKSQEGSDLIFVGRLIKEKNVDLLLRAVALVRNELKNIKCIIIGDGPEKDKLTDLRQRLSLSRNVIFKGFLGYEEVISLMKAAKIFVFPSMREGFGIVVIEAMACGLPVVIVEHPMNAAVEVVRNAGTGSICRLDESDIAKEILRLSANDSIRTAMIMKAKDFISRFDWDTVAKESELFYNGLLKT